jgi:predicted nucleotidyltransferase
VAGAEILTTPDLLGFAGIAPVAVPAIPIVVQVAEKLHAYTRVYEGGRVSSRAKDLVDLALIASLFTVDANELRQTIETILDHHIQAGMWNPEAQRWTDITTS